MDIQHTLQNFPNLNTIYEEDYMKDLEILSLYPSNQAIHVHFTADCEHLAYSSDATDTSGSWLWQSAVRMYQYYSQGINQENPIHHQGNQHILIIKHVTTTTNEGIKKLMETVKVKEIDDQVVLAVWKRIKAAEVGISTLVTQFKEITTKVAANFVEATYMEKECVRVETIYKEWIKNFERMWVEKARLALKKKEKTKVVEYLKQLQKIESLLENVTSIKECKALLQILGKSFKEKQPPAQQDLLKQLRDIELMSDAVIIGLLAEQETPKVTTIKEPDLPVEQDPQQTVIIKGSDLPAEQDALKTMIVNESDLHQEDQLTVQQGALEINLDDFDDFEIIDGPITKSDLDRIKERLKSDQEMFNKACEQLDWKGKEGVKKYFDQIFYHQLVAEQNLLTRHNYNALVLFLSQEAWSDQDYLGSFHLLKKASTNTSVEPIERKTKNTADTIKKIKKQEQTVYLRLETLRAELNFKPIRMKGQTFLGSAGEDSLQQVENLIQEISNEISLRIADQPKKATS